MNFATIVAMLTRDVNAAKRPSWGGYVKKTWTSAEGAATETFKLSFVKRNGTTHEFTWDGSAWTAPSSALTMDSELLSAMLATDWVVGPAADFETARTGSGTW